MPIAKFLRDDPALELLMEPFDLIRGARALPLAERQPGKREEPITGFLEAVGVETGRKPPPLSSAAE